MSYDYNALVAKIQESRRAAASEDASDDEKVTALQESFNTFSTLSECCPMTPLLWMHYACDAEKVLKLLAGDASSAAQSRLQILEMGLDAFPGSAVLHLHYVTLLSKYPGVTPDKLSRALDIAIQRVGQGSHRNECPIIAALYKLKATHLVEQGDPEKALTTFVDRARVPMKESNDGLTGELHKFCRAHSIEVPQEILGSIEVARRLESKIFGTFHVLEDELDAAMYAERVLPRTQVPLDEIDWDGLMNPDAKTCWMGYGGAGSADAFIKYARACSRFKQVNAENDWLERVRSIGLSVYERGLAECPTVEKLWLSYINQLRYLLPKDTTSETASKLRNVVSRSVMNCPYSLKLYQQQLYAQMDLAEAKLIAFDPDELVAIVTKAVDQKFITEPKSLLELHMAVLTVLRRRLLQVIASASPGKDKTPYDDVETVSDNVVVSRQTLDDEIEQEIQDLCEELADAYDWVEQYLKKNHDSWPEGKEILLADRTATEMHLLGPLNQFVRGENEPSPTRIQSLVAMFNKLVKIPGAVHPASFLAYTQSFAGIYPASHPSQILSKLRQVRFLYRSAMKRTGQRKGQAAYYLSTSGEFQTSLQRLCTEFLVFEKLFGSEQSMYDAEQAVSEKLRKFLHQVPERVASPPNNAVADATKGPLKTDSKHVEQHSGKRRKLSDGGEMASVEEAAKPCNEESETTARSETNGKKESSPTPKVRIGKLEYPAHPFTVRVSNLAKETQDMDLVETLRGPCGAIVHARIVREKSHHGLKAKSKGWGLVQFESPESVLKALALDGVLGIHDKLVKIERSHMPAASLVPPGMHRVTPMGQGKSSKQNAKRRQQKADSTPDGGGETIQADGPPKAGANAEVAAASALAFKPRSVATGRKRKLDLNGNE